MIICRHFIHILIEQVDFIVLKVNSTILIPDNLLDLEKVLSCCVSHDLRTTAVLL